MNIRKMQTAAGGPFTLSGKSQKEVDEINNYNKNRAKGLFKGIISGKVLPTMSNIGSMLGAAYNGWIDPETTVITGEVPSPGMIKNPKQIILGFLGAKKVVDATKKYITLTKESTKMLNYPKIGKRYSESQDIMSDGWPIGDILHLKIPDGTHSSLGIGNYYRAIGNRKGLKSVIENGVVAPKGQFSREGKVFWNDGYLDRNYSRKGIFALSYDKSGKAHFYSGNKPQKTYVYSSNNTPIDFYDEALGLHARIPFTQTYKEIPKTQEGIDYALKLDKINRYIEKPIHKLYNWGLKPYLGYKGYKYILEEEKTKQHKFKDGGQIQEKQESSKMNILEFLKNGSGIHIKPSQKGSFTKYCNGKVTDECIRRGKNSPNPKIRKKATFAANSRKWKHKEGGLLKFEEGGKNGAPSTKFLSKLWFKNTGDNIGNFLKSDTGKGLLDIGLNILSGYTDYKKASNLLDSQVEQSKASLEKSYLDIMLEALLNKILRQQQLKLRWQLAYLNGETLDNYSDIVAQHIGWNLYSSALQNAEQLKRLQEALMDLQAKLAKSNALGNLFGSVVLSGLGVLGNVLGKRGTSSIPTTSTSTATTNNTLFSSPLNDSTKFWSIK